MTSQIIWVGIAMGLFFAGIGISYAYFVSTYDPVTMKFQNQSLFDQMMSNNPRMSQQWMNSDMMTNQQMQKMMSDPQLMNQWHQQMMNNPQAMNQWMNVIMSDPQWMDAMVNNQYMMQHMMANTQFQQNWMTPWLSNSTNWNHMMDSGWMNENRNYGMMDSEMMMGGHMMMGTSITQQKDILDTIDNIKKILDNVSKKYRNGDKDTAFSLATNAYLENYEYVENAIAQKDSQIMEKIELMLRVDLRQMIKNGDNAEDIDAKINLIKSELDKAESMFQ